MDQRENNPFIVNAIKQYGEPKTRRIKVKQKRLLDECNEMALRAYYGNSY